MIEQKIIRIHDRDFTDIQKYLNDNWKITHISACGSGQEISTYCYVVIERTNIISD